MNPDNIYVAWPVGKVPITVITRFGLNENVLEDEDVERLGDYLQQFQAN